jgi:hypothetical protein
MPVMLLLAACAGGAAPETANPMTSPESVVDNFLQAAKDSNLVRMADLWGTASGPASRTRVPPDYRKRIEIIQIYLDHDTRRLIGVDDIEGETDQKRIMMELRRGNCVNRVPSSRPGCRTAAGSCAMRISPRSATRRGGATSAATRSERRELCGRGNVLFGELEENSGGGLGVDEGNAPAASAGTRHFIHQAVAGRAARCDRGIQVRHAVAHVVNARSASLEKPGDGAPWIRGLQQLHFRISEGQGDDARAVGQLGPVGLEAEDVAINPGPR